MAGIIQAQYPDYWPETLRALMIHSAEWTPGMLAQFPGDDKSTGACPLDMADAVGKAGGATPFGHPTGDQQISILVAREAVSAEAADQDVAAFVADENVITIAADKMLSPVPPCRL